MFKLFGKKKPVSQARRADGYRECDMPIILWFQQQYEATHIDAVKAGLLAARDPHFVVTKQSLVRFVNNQDWAAMGGGHS